MDRQQVIAFLDGLAQRVDASAGAPLEADAFAGSAPLTALRTACALLAADGAKRGKFVAAGTPWSREEDFRLEQEHESGMSVAQIALEHGRTSSAITLRLVKLGRIDAASIKGRERSVRVA